jgi:Plasmid replication region DNA-binding N-term
MSEVTTPPRRFGPASRGVTAGDVERAADSLLRSGERPTIDRIRQTLGSGSPNTINPLLDAWWKRLGSRLDAGPAALHRLPESVAHVAEALWMQALDEGRRRARLELKSKERNAADQQQSIEVRSHVLSLREGELDSRLRDRDSTIAALNLQLRELMLMLRKEQATREAQARRIASLDEQLLARRPPPKKPPTARTPPTRKAKPTARRAGRLRIATITAPSRKAQKRRSPRKGKRR